MYSSTCCLLRGAALGTMMVFGVMKTEMVVNMRAMMKILDVILLDWVRLRPGRLQYYGRMLKIAEC